MQLQLVAILIAAVLYSSANGYAVVNRPYSTPQRDNLHSTNGSVCADLKVKTVMDTALDYYSHNLDQLAKYILDHVSYRKNGEQYLVHAQKLHDHQGMQWQSTTNGDLFTGRSQVGCFFHDANIYILVLKY